MITQSSSALEPSTSRRVERYLAEVMAASGDPAIVEALRAQLEEDLAGADADAVLGSLEPSSSFAADEIATDPDAADLGALAWSAPVALAVGISASFAAGNLWGEEAGGAALLAALTIAGAASWVARAHPVGRAALGATAAFIALCVLIVVFE